MKKMSVIGALLLFTVACHDTRAVRPIGPDNLLLGVPASNTMIFVPENFDLKVGIPITGVYSYMLSRGTYKPIVEDDKGVFYRSPGGITRVKVNPGGPGVDMDVVNGGIFFDKTKSKAFLWMYAAPTGYTVVFSEEVPPGEFKLESKN
jgi:hypothetical protein